MFWYPSSIVTTLCGVFWFLSKEESSLKVAFLGPKGTYTYGACLKHFGKNAKVTPNKCPTH